MLVTCDIIAPARTADPCSACNTYSAGLPAAPSPCAWRGRAPAGCRPAPSTVHFLPTKAAAGPSACQRSFDTDFWLFGWPCGRVRDATSCLGASEAFRSGRQSTVLRDNTTRRATTVHVDRPAQQRCGGHRWASCLSVVCLAYRETCALRTTCAHRCQKPEPLVLRSDGSRPRVLCPCLPATVPRHRGRRMMRAAA